MEEAIAVLNGVALAVFGPGVLFAGGALIVLMVLIQLVLTIRDRIEI